MYGYPETLCIISLPDGVNKADSIYSADVRRAQGKFSHGGVRVAPIASARLCAYSQFVIRNSRFVCNSRIVWRENSFRHSLFAPFRQRSGF